MTAVRVDIVRFADQHFPGFIEAVLKDAWGSEFRFVEKVPVVTETDLAVASCYPQPGLIACKILSNWRDGRGREIFTIDTEDPWGVESTDHQTRFDVLEWQLTEC